MLSGVILPPWNPNGTPGMPPFKRRFHSSFVKFYILLVEYPARGAAEFLDKNVKVECTEKMEI